MGKELSFPPETADGHGLGRRLRWDVVHDAGAVLKC